MNGKPPLRNSFFLCLLDQGGIYLVPERKCNHGFTYGVPWIHIRDFEFENPKQQLEDIVKTVFKTEFPFKGNIPSQRNKKGLNYCCIFPTEPLSTREMLSKGFNLCYYKDIPIIDKSSLGIFQTLYELDKINYSTDQHSRYLSR
jgi:hypothetical protein